ncbi:hypothetical protein [Amycolatopsis rifamycinica]|nr:hypothetical protein [Amycolatopsis rifamycinica]
MISRLRAVIAALIVVFSLAVAVDGFSATAVPSGPDCFRPCRF